MTFSLGPRHRVQLPILSLLRDEGGIQYSTPGSGLWSATNRSIFYPISLLEPFTVAKAFWVNGATASTDSIDVGAYLMTDPATGRMDLIRSTGAILAANANVVQASSTWRVAKANIASSSTAADANSYTTTSATLKAGRLYLLSVENSHGTSASAVNAITGGPTFTVAGPGNGTTLYNSNLNRVSIWTAVPTVDYTGTLVIDFGGVTQTGCIWSLDEMSGVDTSSNNGIVQAVVGTGNSGTALATLGAFGSANNATFAAHAHAAATASASGAGFTETTDQTAGTPAQALGTYWRVDNDTTADATFTSAQWGSVAVEIKADASPFILPAVPNLYAAMSVSGQTTTFFRINSSAPLQQASGRLMLSSTFPLPSTCVPTASSGNSSTPVAGFSSRILLD